MNRCGLCIHKDRISVEKRLIAGVETLRVIAKDVGDLSESAIQRHARNCLAGSVREQLRSSTAQLHVSDLGQRLMDLADETAQVRLQAKERNDPLLQLRAITSERDTIAALANRLGITDQSQVAQMEESRMFQRAVIQVLHRHPAILREVRDQLSDDGLNGLADDVEFVAARAELHLASTEICA